MRAILALLMLGWAASSAQTQTANDCDKLAWPLQTERQLLAAASAAPKSSGDTVEATSGTAFTLALASGAPLAMEPERKPRGENPAAGYVRVAAPARAGHYRVTISEDGWIDVIQDGRYLKPSSFTGAHACPSLRKSVQVELTASPLIIQISDARAERIGIAITPNP